LRGRSSDFFYEGNSHRVNRAQRSTNTIHLKNGFLKRFEFISKRFNKSPLGRAASLGAPLRFRDLSVAQPKPHRAALVCGRLYGLLVGDTEYPRHRLGLRPPNRVQVVQPDPDGPRVPVELRGASTPPLIG
jgi:hypothetical protein